MSFSDASRAHSRAPSGTLPFSRSRALPDGPAQLRLVSASREELRFEGHTRLQAPVLLCPLLAAIGSLPWLGFEPIDPVRLLVSVTFHAAAIALLYWGWPRPMHATLRPGAQRLEVGGEAIPIPDAARWVLDAWYDDTTAPRGCYVAALDLAGGQRWPLIQSTEPDRVLRELRRALEHWPRAVECRWGLHPTATPWAFAAPASDEPPADADTKRLCRGRASRALVRIVSAATAFVIADLLLLVGSQRARVPDAHVLSSALPVAFAGWLFALTVALATQRECLVIGPRRIRHEARVFGVRRTCRAVPLRDVRAVHVVGATGSKYRHLLLDTASGPLAMAFEAAEAETLRRQLTAALTEAGFAAL